MDQGHIPTIVAAPAAATHPRSSTMAQSIRPLTSLPLRIFEENIRPIVQCECDPNLESHAVIEPIPLFPCGHQFSRACLLKSMPSNESGRICPACIRFGTTNPTAIPPSHDWQLNHTLLRHMSGMKVNCVHPVCKFQMKELGVNNINLVNHLRDECRYEKSPCRDCGEQISRIDMEHHREAVCKKRTRPCKWKCTIENSSNEVNTHGKRPRSSQESEPQEKKSRREDGSTVVPSTTSIQPAAASTSMIRQIRSCDWIQHIENECPNRPIKCRICSEEYRFCDESHHLSGGPLSGHLRKLLEIAQGNAEKANKEIEKLQARLMKTQEKVEELQQKLNRSRSTQPNLSRAAHVARKGRSPRAHTIQDSGSSTAAAAQTIDFHRDFDQEAKGEEVQVGQEEEEDVEEEEEEEYMDDDEEYIDDIDSDVEMVDHIIGSRRSPRLRTVAPPALKTTRSGRRIKPPSNQLPIAGASSTTTTAAAASTPIEGVDYPLNSLESVSQLHRPKPFVPTVPLIVDIRGRLDLSPNDANWIRYRAGAIENGGLQPEDTDLTKSPRELEIGWATRLKILLLGKIAPAMADRPLKPVKVQMHETKVPVYEYDFYVRGFRPPSKWFNMVQVFPILKDLDLIGPFDTAAALVRWYEMALRTGFTDDRHLKLIHHIRLVENATTPYISVDLLWSILWLGHIRALEQPPPERLALLEARAKAIKDVIQPLLD